MSIYENMDYFQIMLFIVTPGGYSVRKLLGVCRGPLKIGPKKIEGKMVFGGQKDRILWGFVPKRSFLCWWMRKNTPKRSSLVPRGSKKGVKTAAHMYHPSYREHPPPPPPPDCDMFKIPENIATNYYKISLCVFQYQYCGYIAKTRLHSWKIIQIFS